MLHQLAQAHLQFLKSSRSSSHTAKLVNCWPSVVHSTRLTFALRFTADATKQCVPELHMETLTLPGLDNSASAISCLIASQFVMKITMVTLCSSTFGCRLAISSSAHPTTSASWCLETSLHTDGEFRLPKQFSVLVLSLEESSV